MILMIKQLFNQETNVEILELKQRGFLQQQNLKDFQPDIIVGTRSEHSVEVLELAMQNEIAYALFQPNLTEIQTMLQRSFEAQYQHCGKILFLQQQDHYLMDLSDNIVSEFQQYGQLMLEGDYLENCIQLAFDSIYLGVQVID